MPPFLFSDIWRNIMKNFKQPGDVLDVVATADIVSGQPLSFGNINGVAHTSALTGEDFALQTKGVFELPKAGPAVAVGAKAYLLADGTAITGTASGNTRFGTVTEAALLADTVVNVKLIQL